MVQKYFSRLLGKFVTAFFDENAAYFYSARPALEKCGFAVYGYLVISLCFNFKRRIGTVCSPSSWTSTSRNISDTGSPWLTTISLVTVQWKKWAMTSFHSYDHYCIPMDDQNLGIGNRHIFMTPSLSQVMWSSFVTFPANFWHAKSMGKSQICWMVTWFT